MNVLYVHHAAPFGGASRSLFELVRTFPTGSVQSRIVTKSGKFQSILNEAGIEVIGCRGVSQFDNTRYSYYRGLRWIVLMRELAYLPATFLVLLAAKKRWGEVDVVHFNELTLLPAIWIARKLYDCPFVVHVRSVQRPMNDIRGKFIHSFLSKNVDRLIAIDETVKNSLASDLNIEVVHNGLRVAQNPHFEPYRFSAGILTIGMVGGLSRAKGCLELIEAAKICRDRGEKFRIVFVGESNRSPAPLREFLLKLLGVAQDVHKEMLSLIESYGLESIVEFWPFTTELENIYDKLDLICFPSHFDAPGRPIFEAALFGIPSIAAITKPTDDSIKNGVTGLTISPRSPLQLADAITFMCVNPDKRIEMGKNANKLALKNFDIKKNTQKILDIYHALIGPSS